VSLRSAASRVVQPIGDLRASSNSQSTPGLLRLFVRCCLRVNARVASMTVAACYVLQTSGRLLRYSAQRTKCPGLTYSSHYPPLPSASIRPHSFRVTALSSIAHRSVSETCEASSNSPVPQVCSDCSLRCCRACARVAIDSCRLLCTPDLAAARTLAPSTTNKYPGLRTVATINRYRQLRPTAQLSCHCTLSSITVQPYQTCESQQLNSQSLRSAPTVRVRCCHACNSSCVDDGCRLLCTPD
jgi:hypothetical protein